MRVVRLVLIWLTLADCAAASAALRLGDSYDFRFNDGQTIKNAEVLNETADGYSVRLAFNLTGDSIYILKADLLSVEPAKRNTGQAAGSSTRGLAETGSSHLKRPIVVAHIGMAWLSNQATRIGQIFPASFGFHGQVELQPGERRWFGLDLVFLKADFSRFTQDTRYLQIVTGVAGAGVFLWRSNRLPLQIVGAGGLGLTHRDMQGYEFAERNSALAAALILEGRYLSGPVAYGLAISATYIHDRGIFFMPLSVSGSIGLRF